MDYNVSSYRPHFIHSLSLTSLKTKLTVETGIWVKHKYHFLILPWITAPISVFPTCPYSPVHSRDNKWKGKIPVKIYFWAFSRIRSICISPEWSFTLPYQILDTPATKPRTSAQMAKFIGVVAISWLGARKVRIWSHMLHSRPSTVGLKVSLQILLNCFLYFMFIAGSLNS